MISSSSARSAMSPPRQSGFSGVAKAGGISAVPAAVFKQRGKSKPRAFSSRPPRHPVTPAKESKANKVSSPPSSSSGRPTSLSLARAVVSGDLRHLRRALRDPRCLATVDPCAKVKGNLEMFGM